MLDDIKINGFRRLDGLKIQGTSPFNLIVGPNNSGKTSLLEALFLHSAPLNCRALLSLLSFRSGGIIPNQQYVFEGFRWFFSVPFNRQTLEQSIQGKWNNKSRETTVTMLDTGFEEEKNSMSQIGNSTTDLFSSEIVRNNFYTDKDIEGISIGKLIFSFKSDNQKLVQQEYKFSTKGPIVLPAPKVKTDIPAVFSDPFAHRGPEAGVEQYDNAVKKGHEKICLQLLQMIDTEIKDISILLTPIKTPQLFVTHASLGKTPITNLGDGVRRIYRLALQIAEAENGVLLIDELENSIHSSALKEFIQWLVKTIDRLNVQVFATTHSLECIDAVLSSSLSKTENLCLFNLKKEDSRISCKKIDGEKLEKIRYELGYDVR